MNDIYVLVDSSGGIVKAFASEDDAEKAVTGVNYGEMPTILRALSTCHVPGARLQYKLNTGASLYLVPVRMWKV